MKNNVLIRNPYIYFYVNFYHILLFKGYFKDRNGPLLVFFKGVMGESYQTANAVILSNAVESVYFLCNKNFIGPLAFAKSLLIYSKTGAIFFILR